MLSAFGVGFFYRVVLPGILSVILLAPIRPTSALAWLGIVDIVDKTAIFIVAVFAFGLVLSSARHAIYYTLEGFYWIPWGERLRKRMESKIRRAHTELSNLDSKRETAEGLSDREKLRELHLNEFLGDFRIVTEQKDSRYVVERPTRIGNVMAAYEEYARDRYGFDGAFYWFHIRFSAEAPVQAELDRTEAIADGLVFCAFAAPLISFLYACIMAGRLVGTVLDASRFRGLLVPAPAPDRVLISFLLASLIACALFNRLALSALRTFGSQMRAVIDLAVPRVIKLGDPWLPSELHLAQLATRQTFLTQGKFPKEHAPDQQSGAAGKADPTTP